MFPTHVGMNRKDGDNAGRGRNVPHTRGDEPTGGMSSWKFGVCSPHTWG